MVNGKSATSGLTTGTGGDPDEADCCADNSRFEAKPPAPREVNLLKKLRRLLLIELLSILSSFFAARLATGSELMRECTPQHNQ
jgi:hypothetical protein